MLGTIPLVNYLWKEYRGIGKKAQGGMGLERLHYVAYCVYKIRKLVFRMSISYNVGICQKFPDGIVISEHTTTTSFAFSLFTANFMCSHHIFAFRDPSSHQSGLENAIV